jgi:hypothetical protein
MAHGLQDGRQVYVIPFLLSVSQGRDCCWKCLAMEFRSQTHSIIMSFITVFDHLNLAPPHSSPPNNKKKLVIWSPQLAEPTSYVTTLPRSKIYSTSPHAGLNHRTGHKKQPLALFHLKSNPYHIHTFQFLGHLTAVLQFDRSQNFSTKSSFNVVAPQQQYCRSSHATHLCSTPQRGNSSNTAVMSHAYHNTLLCE